VYLRLSPSWPGPGDLSQRASRSADLCRPTGPPPVAAPRRGATFRGWPEPSRAGRATHSPAAQLRPTKRPPAQVAKWQRRDRMPSTASGLSVRDKSSTSKSPVRTRKSSSAPWRVHYAGVATTAFFVAEAKTSTSVRCHLHQLEEGRREAAKLCRKWDTLGTCPLGDGPSGPRRPRQGANYRHLTTPHTIPGPPGRLWAGPALGRMTAEPHG
jgi:hypothetical protein